MKNINFCHFIKSKGFNNERLAHAVGITPGMMTDRSTGRTQITLSEAVKAANALGVSIEEFSLHIPNIPTPQVSGNGESLKSRDEETQRILDALAVLVEAAQKKKR